MEILDKAKNILATVAPSIGTALAGPMGGLAAKAVSNALLGKESGSLEEINDALVNADASQLLKLKNVEQQFALDMKKLDVDVKKLEIGAADRDSARKRQAAMGDHTPTILAILTMVSFFGYIAAVTFLPSARGADVGLVNVAIGWLGGTASTVIAYYFGSSAGSKKKTEGLVK
jgi:hypothetical protein